MNKKKIFGIILFIFIGLFMISFANPNEEVKLYDCGDTKKSKQKEVTACVNEMIEEGSTEKKALSTCRKTYCSDSTSNKEKEENLTENKKETQENDSTITNNNVVQTVPVTNNTTIQTNNNRNDLANNILNNDISNSNSETNNDINNSNSEINNEENNSNSETNNKLKNLKEKTIKELKQYYESLKFDSKYQSQAKEILENSINNINISENGNQIKKAFEDGKEELDELLKKQELENYKKEAINNLENYKEELKLKDDEEKIENAKKEIEGSSTKEEIDKIVEDTKEELKKLKEQQDLSSAIEKAIEELKQYKVDYVYDIEFKGLYEKLLDEYIEKINSSKTLEEVANYLELGKKEIDDLINEDLNKYKEKATTEINNYVDLNNYREEQIEEIKNIISESTKNINEALTKEEIDNIVENTKKLLDSIKTDEELTKEETRYVTFVDYNGKVIEKQPVKIGESAKAPNVKTTHTSRYITYTFVGWDKEFTNIKENITVKALYELTDIKANIYVLKEGNKRPANGESLGTKAYEHIGIVNLNVTEELKNIVSANKTKIISLDKETILKNVTGTLPSAKEFYYYEYYVLKFEQADGFHIDCELIFDSVAFENYKKEIIDELKNYSNSLELTSDNKNMADEIINNASDKINNANTKEEIETIKNETKQELDSILSSIKEKAIKELEEKINNSGLTGSYSEKANDILNIAKEEINNATTETDVNNLKNKYITEIDNLMSLSKKTFDADINTKNIFKLKKLSITDIASDVIINKISYVYPFGFEDEKYINNEYHSSILLDEEIEDLLFGATIVKIEYTKDNVKYVNKYSIKRNILSSITGLKLIETSLK